MNPSNNRVYRFADVEVDAAQGCLRRGGREHHLRQKTFQVLVYLLEQHERLVTKEELIARVWPETAVTDDAVVQCVMDIRRTLGDDSRHPRFIKTIPKVGYRFISPIEEGSLNGLVTVETEEVTTLQVEFEEETIDSIQPTEAVPKLLPALPAQRRFISGKFALVSTALALILITAAAFFIYFRQGVRHAKEPLADVTLPHVPGKKPLAVMYFENQSKNPELDWLREGLADMLITDLSRSTKLTVLSRQQLHLLLERIGHRQGNRIHLDEALEVAQRSKAEAILLGSFACLGEKVRIDVQLHDGRSGQFLVAERLIVDRPEQILTQIDLVSLKLAAHLGAAPTVPDRKVGLADVMTDNLEAYRYYSLAVERAHGFHNKDAIALLEKAVALDPRFAMAQARIGYAYAVTWGLADQGKPHLERAFQLSDRLTEKDTLYITAWYAIANLDYASAVRPLQNIIANYPLEIEAYQRLGHLLRGEERFEEAISVLRRGLVIDPEAKDIYNALGGIYSNLGRHTEAIAMMQRYVQLAPEEPNAHDSLALIYQWSGHYDQALNEYNRALSLRPEFEISIVNRGNLFFQLGRHREALGQYQRYIRMARSDMEREKGYGSLAWVYWKKGELNKAAEAAQKELQYGRRSSVGNSLMIALERGDLATAEKLKEQLFVKSPYTHRGARPPLRYLYYFFGSFDLKCGRTTEALANFREALKHLPPLGGIEALDDCLANAYLELGQLDEAISEYDRILRLNPNYPLAHYHLGQAYERKWERAPARAAYERFLQSWKDADPDLPQLIDAKERLANL